MADSPSKRSLKQIAKSYSGNLAYYKAAHYFRELRKRVFLMVTLAALVSALLIAGLAWLQKPGKKRFVFAQFYNQGPVSRGHAHFANDCGQCHQAPNDWVRISVKSTPIDRACLKCHKGMDFHQSNVLQEHSCSACHLEHRGAGPMAPVKDAHCSTCHGSTEVLGRSFKAGQGLPAPAFDRTPPDGLVHFQFPRPAGGFTTAFQGFDRGHPEFQMHREAAKDPNTLKFNHKVHLSGKNIPLVKGQPLDCKSCHVPDPSGAYMQAVTFEKNCRSCHSIQFDPRNPGIEVPHGNADEVRRFLATLPIQYEKAGRERGITDPQQLKSFVRNQLIALKQDAGSGRGLEKDIFFNGGDRGTIARISGMPVEGKVRYAGCAYCHQVEEMEGGNVKVTPPVTPDRWLVRSRFNHGKHVQMKCTDCHQAKGSELTSDILIPAQKSCLECHSSKGGVVSTCQTCHGYHAPVDSPASRLWHEAAKKLSGQP